MPSVITMGLLTKKCSFFPSHSVYVYFIEYANGHLNFWLIGSMQFGIYYKLCLISNSHLRIFCRTCMACHISLSWIWWIKCVHSFYFIYVYFWTNLCLHEWLPDWNHWFLSSINYNLCLISNRQVFFVAFACHIHLLLIWWIRYLHSFCCIPFI